MTPVNALVVSPPSPVWGAQLRLLDYAPALAGRGVTLTLGSPPAGDFHAAWVDAGLPHREIDVPFVEGIRDPETGRRPGAAVLADTAAGVGRGVLGVIGAANDFDVVWSFALRAHAGVALASRLRRVPLVLEVVDIVRPGLGRRILQLAAAMADATIVNSHATAEALGGRARRLHVIHPGVDPDRFRPGAPDPDVRDSLAVPGGMLVGVVGRLDPMKGIHTIVDAIDRMQDDHDVRLVVVGDVGVRPDAYARDLRDRATELMGDRVRFTGRRNDIPDVLRALDVLVNASAAEPFGRSVLEAQACGVPVVVGNSGGPPEFVVDHETGMVVEPSDPQALADALDQLAADDELRRRLGEAARRHAEQDFDIETRYDRVAEVLREVARR